MVSQRGPYRLQGTALKLQLDSTNLQYLVSDINELGFIFKDDLLTAIEVASELIRESLHSYFFELDKVYTNTYLQSIEFDVIDTGDSVDLTVDVIPQGLEADELPYYSKVLEFGSKPGEEIEHWNSQGDGESILRQRLRRWASVKGIPAGSRSAVIKSIIKKLKKRGRIAEPILGEFFTLYLGDSGKGVKFRIGAPRGRAFEILHNELVQFATESKFQGLSTARVHKGGSIQLRTRRGRWGPVINKG